MELLARAEHLVTPSSCSVAAVVSKYNVYAFATLVFIFIIILYRHTLIEREKESER